MPNYSRNFKIYKMAVDYMEAIGMPHLETKNGIELRLKIVGIAAVTFCFARN